MDINLNVLRLAKALAEHAAERQSLIAQNVANADTPGYRALDMSAFSDSYNTSDATGLAIKATRPGHLGRGDMPMSHSVFETRVVGAESPNGNSVSIEDQMLRAVETRQAHELALGVYSKTMDILRSTVRRSS